MNGPQIAAVLPRENWPTFISSLRDELIPLRQSFLARNEAFLKIKPGGLFAGSKARRRGNLDALFTAWQIIVAILVTTPAVSQSDRQAFGDLLSPALSTAPLAQVMQFLKLLGESQTPAETLSLLVAAGVCGNCSTQSILSVEQNVGEDIRALTSSTQTFAETNAKTLTRRGADYQAPAPSPLDESEGTSGGASSCAESLRPVFEQVMKYSASLRPVFLEELPGGIPYSAEQVGDSLDTLMAIGLQVILVHGRPPNITERSAQQVFESLLEEQQGQAALAAFTSAQAQYQVAEALSNEQDRHALAPHLARRFAEVHVHQHGPILDAGVAGDFFGWCVATASSHGQSCAEFLLELLDRMPTSNADSHV